MNTLLQVENLKTYFRTYRGIVKAVDDVSFHVNDKEIIGLVGESGCGKSVTMLSVMQLITTPPGKIVGGKVIFEGQDLLQYKAKGDQMSSIRGGKIAMIFQEPMTSLNPVLTICRQLTETLECHLNMDSHTSRLRAIELLKLVGIPEAENRIDAYPHQFSGGMRQRVMIAMALSCNPKIIIADEPTTALDVTTQAQILDLLRNLQQQRGMSIMLITHNLGVIAEMADNVAVMYLGRIVEKGPVDVIFHDPQHPYTQALLRSIPSLRSKARTILPTISGSIPHPYNRPPGCPFHPRCPRYMRGICNAKEPGIVAVGDRHEASCFLYEGA